MPEPEPMRNSRARCAAAMSSSSAVPGLSLERSHLRELRCLVMADFGSTTVSCLLSVGFGDGGGDGVPPSSIMEMYGEDGVAVLCNCCGNTAFEVPAAGAWLYTGFGSPWFDAWRNSVAEIGSVGRCCSFDLPKTVGLAYLVSR